MRDGGGKALSPGRATEFIRSIARDDPELEWTDHSQEQMAERDLLVGDVLYVLKNGFVHEEGQPTTRTGFFRYCMESSTPNSNGRDVRVVVIPSPQRQELKIVTVMWIDEPGQRG
jgi:hypothetical protein